MKRKEKNMTYEQFEIESLPGQVFRVAKISPVDLMAITQTIDFDRFEANQALIRFCLENAEVLMGEKWLPVKTKGREVYQPMGIEGNIPALNDIFLWMMQNVIAKSFTKSSGSTEKTE